jgi:hypothetical protein
MKHNQNTEILLGIDPGSEKSGIVLLKDHTILKGDTLSNEDMFTLVDKYSIFTPDQKFFVVYEDIRPYTSRFNMATINTCKVIGRLEYVLNQQRIAYKAISRNEVKAFVYNKYTTELMEDIKKKILRKKRFRLNGEPFKPSFQHVDDRIVKKAMKLYWGLGTPKPGKPAANGIKDHAWQALAAATCYISKENAFADPISDTFGN